MFSEVLRKTKVRSCCEKFRERCASISRDKRTNNSRSGATKKWWSELLRHQWLQQCWRTIPSCRILCSAFRKPWPSKRNKTRFFLSRLKPRSERDKLWKQLKTTKLARNLCWAFCPTHRLKILVLVGKTSKNKEVTWAITTPNTSQRRTSRVEKRVKRILQATLVKWKVWSRSGCAFSLWQKKNRLKPSLQRLSSQRAQAAPKTFILTDIVTFTCKDC